MKTFPLIISSPDGDLFRGDAGMLILRGTDLPEALTSDRRQNVSIEREVISGLRIPSSALSEKNTVFIDANGTATEIKVTPVVNENGCCLVEASSAEGALKAGDRVLAGESIARANLTRIRAKGLDTSSAVIVTNSDIIKSHTVSLGEALGGKTVVFVGKM